MKKVSLAFLVLFSMNSKAQDSRLFENIWYLHDLILDGIHYNPPINNEIPFIPAEFIAPNVFFTGICEAGGQGEIIYDGITVFNFQNLAFLAGGCYQNQPFNEAFNNQYVYMYWMATSQNIFTYEITEMGAIKTLRIINSNGDEAIYGNEILTVIDIDVVSISIFPNPTSSRVMVLTKELISNISLFDSLGQLLMEQKETDELNLSSFSKGIYFLRVTLGDKFKTFKVIKN